MTDPRGHPFLARLGEGPLLADGAMGTMLYARGVPFDQCFDAVNLTNPDLVRGIHRAYLEAGAELLETNTFGANRLKLAGHGLADRLAEINAAGAQLAHEVAASAGRRIWIAGSIGPLGRPMAPLGAVSPEEATDAFVGQARALADGGVDLLILETFTDLNELEAAVRGAQRTADLPIIGQMTFALDGRTLLGYAPEEIAARLEALGVAAIGANCSVGPYGLLEVMERMATVSKTPLSAMPNAGLPSYAGGRLAYVASPAYMAEHARALAEMGVAVIGGCCGTTPEHIAAMRVAIAGRQRGPARPSATVAVPPTPPPAPAPDPPGSLAQRLGKRFVLTVEVSPPRGARDADELEHCRRLRAAGVDAVDVADNPMARLRMSPWAMAARIQREVGLETILHFTTRDRNLIRLQSDLLAVHALGIRTLLVLRGDLPQTGDYPRATAVSDVHPSGLVRMIRGFNEGKDVAGNLIGTPTRFLVGVALNMAARDLDRELRALDRKLAAGADFICTMPIFEAETFDRFLARVGEVPVPVLVGVLPLHSLRHAEFLHNELPGMVVPEAIRAQMRQARDGRETGMRLARELLLALRDRAAGAYLVPSFGRYDRIADLASEMRAALATR
ncbi:MAG: bifunctional homocysteine S-methyltransferase/methylenetetrahydrofolate reductase [Armatimonadetes bacterium]|nr:bifunctional homocysteine S-methyltransferase/methylenetetrahydrofolate reductase [Armatimonadota bacterium]